MLRARAERGVTLVELLIVMIIIAILSVVIFVSMTSNIDNAAEASAADLRNNLDRLGPVPLWGSSEDAPRFVDRDGNAFGACEIPLHDGFLDAYVPELVGGGDDSCHELLLQFPGGHCVDPAATAGSGLTLGSAECMTRADCPGPTWSGCGSFDRVKMILQPRPSCALAVALATVGRPLSIWMRECRWVCDGVYVRLDCDPWALMP